MSEAGGKREAVTFTPGLRGDDQAANYWMRQATLRLRREICWCWHERGLMPGPAALPPFSDRAAAALDMGRFEEKKRRFFLEDPTARYLTAQLSASPPEESQEYVQGSFSWAVAALGLDEVSAFVLALGLIGAFDSAAGSVIAACLNDPQKAHASLALAQRLWDRPEEVSGVADPAHPLFRYGLLQYAGRGNQDVSGIEWDTPVIVPTIVASQLLFPGSPLQGSLAPVNAPGENDRTSPGRAVPAVDLAGYALCSRLCIVPVLGPRGSPRTETVLEMVRAAGREAVRYRGDPRHLENLGYLNAIATLCWLKDVDLFLDGDVAPAVTGEKRGCASQLPFHTIPVKIYLGVAERSQVSGIPGDLLLPAAEVPRMSYAERVDHWKKTLGPDGDGLDDAIAECSRRFRYEKETISDIGQSLHGAGDRVSGDDLLDACRARADLDLGDLAQKVAPRFDLEELVLPPKQERQVGEIIRAMEALTEVHYGWGTGRAWNEGGISVLFAGPPGSGKTMAAEAIATRIGLPLYRIDLSQVVNKYIGETEKNLKKLFDAADSSDLVLFFDEADSLFGRRSEVKDAHDRYANLEISYLLERMERFKGLAILATNRKKDLDEAFLRRLRYVVDFPFPEAGERARIWRQVVPPGVDGSGLDIDFLARQFPLAGGHIRSVIFNACLQSASEARRREGSRGRLTMETVIVAVRREYDKLNQSVSLDRFGPYAHIIREAERDYDRR